MKARELKEKAPATVNSILKQGETDACKQKLSRFTISRLRIKEILRKFFGQKKNDLTCKHGNAGRKERHKPV